MASEEVKLKEKINRLIDKIGEMDTQLKERESHIKLLEEEVRMLQARMPQAGESAEEAQENAVSEESEIFSFIRDFCKVAMLIIQNEAYIKYTYETKNSSSFYKIEQSVFNDYICKYAALDLKSFLNYCVDLGLVKSEKNRKYIYSSGETKVYYVSRPFMDAACRQEIKQEAAG